MPATIDIVAVVARGVVLAGVIQAAGAALFLLLIGPSAEAGRPRIQRLAAYASVLVALAVLVRSALEPARMAGAFAGVADPFLWSLFWQSDVALAQALRLVGAAALFLVISRPGRSARAVQWLAVCALLASFTTMGHVRVHDGALLLGIIVTAHVAAVAYWGGALVPLLLVLRDAPAGTAAEIIAAFSRVAVRVVAVLFAAGVALAAVLLGGIEGLATPYGLLVLLKLSGFLALLVLAALNRFRWTPKLTRDSGHARQALRRSIMAEIALMLGVIGATATMTTLFSPS